MAYSLETKIFELHRRGMSSLDDMMEGRYPPLQASFRSA